MCGEENARGGRDGIELALEDFWAVVDRHLLPDGVYERPVTLRVASHG
jgi:hypothetical protein